MLQLKFNPGLTLTGFRTTQPSSRCCCAEDGKEIQDKLCRTYTTIVLLTNPFVWRSSLCRCRRGLPNLLIAFGMRIRNCS